MVRGYVKGWNITHKNGLLKLDDGRLLNLYEHHLGKPFTPIVAEYVKLKLDRYDSNTVRPKSVYPLGNQGLALGKPTKPGTPKDGEHTGPGGKTGLAFIVTLVAAAIFGITRCSTGDDTTPVSTFDETIEPMPTITSAPPTMQDVLDAGWSDLSAADQASVCLDWSASPDDALAGFERGFRALDGDELLYFVNYFDLKCGTNYGG